MAKLSKSMIIFTTITICSLLYIALFDERSDIAIAGAASGIVTMFMMFIAGAHEIEEEPESENDDDEW